MRNTQITQCKAHYDSRLRSLMSVSCVVRGTRKQLLRSFVQVYSTCSLRVEVYCRLLFNSHLLTSHDAWRRRCIWTCFYSLIEFDRRDNNIWLLETDIGPALLQSK